MYPSPTSSIAAANEFIELGLKEPTYPIDPMKLQKLLFYAHGWHLALHESPLFEQDFEAWPWGPVVRDVYLASKHYGRAAIAAPLQELVMVEFAPIGAEFEVTKVEDPGTKDFIRSVWNSHKQFSGIQLSNATHRPGEPWTIVRDQYGTLAGKPIIPNELIQAVFKAKRAKSS